MPAPAALIAPAAADAPGRARVLKDERCARVELLEERGVLRKTYRPRRFLGWRTFGQRSRAAREYRALAAARARGVPCVEPLAFGEVRRWGCVPSCWLETRWVPGCRDLRALWREAPARGTGAAGARLRRSLAIRAGRLFAQLHRAGVLWCTLTPRNVLVQGDPESGRLLACDMPAALCFRRSIHGTRRARIDLWDGCASDSRRRELSKGDRFGLLLAYSDGDRARARGLWRALARRARWRNRAEKGLVRGLLGYVAVWLGRGEAAPPSPQPPPPP